MTPVKKLFLFLGLAVCCALVGCGPGGSTSEFRLHTFHLNSGSPVPDSYIYVGGTCYDCALNTTVYFDSSKRTVSSAQTDVYGYRTVTDKYVNLFWGFTRTSGACGIVNYGLIFVKDNDTVPMECHLGTIFNTDPDTMDVNSPASSLVFSGDSVLDTTYDLPTVDFYDETGNYIGSTAASSVSGGSSATVTTPSFLLSQYSGSYVAVISNVNADTSLTVVAAAAIDLYGNDAPPPDDCGCGMSCEEYDSTVAACTAASGTWLSWGCVCQN